MPNLHVEVIPRDDGLEDIEVTLTNATKEEAEAFYSDLIAKAKDLGVSMDPQSGIYRTN